MGFIEEGNSGIRNFVVLAAVDANYSWIPNLNVWSSVDLDQSVEPIIDATSAGGEISNYSSDGKSIEIKNVHDSVWIANSALNDTTKINLDGNASLNAISIGSNYSHDTDMNPGNDILHVSGAFWELDGRHISGVTSGSSGFMAGAGYDIFRIDATSKGFKLQVSTQKNTGGYYHNWVTLVYEGPSKTFVGGGYEFDYYTYMNLHGVEEIVFSDVTIKVDDIVNGKTSSNYKRVWADDPTLVDLDQNRINNKHSIWSGPRYTTLQPSLEAPIGQVNIYAQYQVQDPGKKLKVDQVDWEKGITKGAVVWGSSNNDQIYSKAGWDRIQAGDGNDIVRAGNGRDVITGGKGADELHGDFGWNTYTSEKDGYRDLIVVKSDNNLVNWLYKKAGNNPNGVKADIIEGLDPFDSVRILGAGTSSLHFQNASAHGVEGIGIFAGGALEALYVGGDLSLDQLKLMTSGDPAAIPTSADGVAGTYGWTG